MNSYNRSRDVWQTPEILRRNFSKAYFLPAAFFLVLSAGVLKQFGYWSTISAWMTGYTLFDILLGALIAWITGILLRALNQDIYGFLTGHGKYNPLRLFEKKAKTEFRRKRGRLNWLDQEYRKKGFTDELRNERKTLLEELALGYPHEEAFVLPTAFGNAVRAFEAYPYVMYGFDWSEGWSRILAVLPKEYRELIDDAKAQADWWVNLGVMSVVLLIEFWAAIFGKGGLTHTLYYTGLNIVIPLAIFAPLNWFLFRRATGAVIDWGNYVRSAFDVYRFALLQSIGVGLPRNRKAEKELWTRYSQATHFRLPSLLPDLKQPNNRSRLKKGRE